MAVLQKFDGADKRNGYEWLFDDIALVDIQRWAARLNIRLRRRHAGGRAARSHARAADARRLVPPRLTYDGKGKAAGLHLYLNGKRPRTSRSCAMRWPDRYGATTPLTRRQPVARARRSAAARRPPPLQPRAHRRRGRAAGAALPCARHPVWRDRQALPRRSAVPARLLPDVTPLRRRCAPPSREARKLRAERAELQKVIPTAMVMAEMKKPRDTFVLARGDYRNQTEKVQPGVPAMLPPLPEGRAAQPPDAGPLARRSRSIRSPRASPSIASGRPISATASSRRRKTSACRASRRCIPSCSTGWPPSSSAPAGTSARCSG